MGKIINDDSENIVYMEVWEKRDLKVRFAWIDGRLFLPIALFRDERLRQIVCTSAVDVYHRAKKDGFVPTEWLCQQYPSMARELEDFRKLVQNFFVGIPNQSTNKR